MRWWLLLLIACGEDHHGGPADAHFDGSPDGTPDGCVDDCAGVCGGTATIDRCGLCNTDPTDDCKWSDSATAYCSTGTMAMACPTAPNRQDGDILFRVPAYTITTDTVTDPFTGLEWERNPAYTDIDQPTATTYCANLTIGTADDWRLPTRLELVSLIDAGVVLPGFTHAAFSGVPQNAFFWTSTPVAGVADSSWMIGTNYPVLTYFANTGPFTEEPVRCVRGPAFTGAFVATTGAVLDTRTNLEWEDAATAMTWQNGLAYCSALGLHTLHDWRLPSQKELASLVDDTQTGPAISTVFTARPAAVFWTSSPVPNFPTQAYAIDFATGENKDISNLMSTSYDVRCVRASQYLR